MREATKLCIFEGICMEGGVMEAKDVFTLGLGLSEPWKLSGQRLDVEKRPNELHLEVIADRGALFPCPECRRACKAHDFDVPSYDPSAVSAR